MDWCTLANWAALQEQLAGLPVAKRAKHGIHFDNGDGSIMANFAGKPVHYLDGATWRAIDTTPLLMGDGRYGCPHSPVRIGTDGTVSISGSDYAQRARLISGKNVTLVGDHLVRTFANGEQRLYITEDGFRSEITLNSKPNLLQALYLIATTSGRLPDVYVQHPTTMTDANGASYTYDTALNLRNWLEAAKYPVVIDPDFSAGQDRRIYGGGGGISFATARATSVGQDTNIEVGTYVNAGKTDRYVIRLFEKFDTSSVDDTATVSQVNLKLVATVNNSTEDFDVQIVKYNWSAFDAAPTNATVRDTAFDGVLAADRDDNIWRNSNGISINTQYTSGNLNTAWVSKTGTTYYALQSNLDYLNTIPNDVSAHLGLAGSGHATPSYRPVLTVLYTTGIAVPIAQYYYNRLRRN